MASHIAKIRLLDELAKLVSTIFSPLLTPSYGLFLALSISPKVLDTTGARIKLLIIFFGITCVLPMATIAVLHNIKLIKDKKKGRSSCGCNCGSCPMSGSCKSSQKK